MKFGRREETTIPVRMLKDMDRVLEEFGKWFLNAGLVVFATFVLKPFRDTSFSVSEFLAALTALASLLAFGGVLLYLSKRVRSSGNGTGL